MTASLVPSQLVPARPVAQWSPWAFWRSQRVARAWAAPPAQTTGWYVPLGVIARHGTYWHAAWHSWSQPLEARLGRLCAHGCTDDTLDQFPGDTLVDACLAGSSPALRLLDLTDLFHAYRTTQGWGGWADPDQQALARYRFVPLWHRDTQRDQSGWRHPRWSWLFIPDWTPLAPFNQRWTADPAVSLGQQIATIVPTLLAADITWLDSLPHPIPTALGFQFAVWQAMGLGYFDVLEAD